MPFDLTKEIKLDKKSYSYYKRLQITFYAFCFAISLYVAHSIFFPAREFNFSFQNLTSNKGNAVNPRDSEGTFITDGKFIAGQKSYFDTTLLGNFSSVKLSFTPNEESALPKNAPIELRKSYRAFLYPEGSPLGFKNGTLLRNKDDFYLISEGKLRKFGNFAIVETLGFSEIAFLAIDNDADLAYNPSGTEIIDTLNYPADSLFKINTSYYRLNSANALEKFTSEKAFLSQYDKNLAIPKNSDFIKHYPLAKKLIGFSDGSLVSYGSSVYVISKSELYPIGNPDIFITQGYDWNDIITISGDEFSFYEKAKLFTLTSVHPDGTIFFTPDSHKWYQIENAKKHELPSEKIANSYLKKKPITVSARSLEVLESCKLRKESLGDYSCTIPLNDKEDTPGKYYEFALNTRNALWIDNLNLLYEKNITILNLKLALHNMILKIKARYNL